jgi:ELWxxDGT repeat protein
MSFRHLIWLIAACIPTAVSAQSLVKDIHPNGLPESGGPIGYGLSTKAIGKFGDRAILAVSTEYGWEPWITDGTEAGTRILVDAAEDMRDSHPRAAIEFNSHCYFVTTDGSQTNGLLWRTDGTRQGTTVIAEFPIWGPDFMGLGWDNYVETAVAGNTLYFTASGAIWKSDGTSAGSEEVAGGVLSFVGGTMEACITPVGNELFFFGTTLQFGRELWKTDGTQQGTVMVADIAPGAESGIEWARGMYAWNNEVYFAASSGIRGESGLWKSDGTAAGTIFLGGPAPVHADRYVEFNGYLYYEANGLWRTDGTPAGTEEVVYIVGPAWLMNQTGNVIVHNGLLYFVAGDYLEVWVSDGTAAGTRRLADVTGFMVPDAFKLTVLGSTVVFLSKAELSPVTGEGMQLWSTDGTASGTVKVRQVGHAFSGIDFRGPMLVAGGKAYLELYEPWVSDGSANGTRRIAPLRARATGFRGWDRNLYGAEAGGRLVFSAMGRLWATDGTRRGTRELHDDFVVWQSEFVKLGNHLYFNIDGAAGALVRTDGTRSGTRSMSDIHSVFSFGCGPLGVLNDTLFFAKVGQPATQTQLWTTDGTGSGTQMLLPAGLSADSFYYPNAIATGNVFLFSAHNVLWRSDGTAAGTYELSSDAVNPILRPSTVVELNGEIFLLADSPAGGVALYKTDGVSGSALVASLSQPASTEFQPEVVVFDGAIFTAGDDGTQGWELWRSDGTPPGTGPFRIITGGPQPGFPAGFRVVNDRLLFVAMGLAPERELWASDGTVSGTSMLMRIGYGTSNGRSTESIVYRDRLYFAADDEMHGRELWRTDGTVDGTELVADIHKGPLSSSPADFIGAGDMLFFTAIGEDIGRELYVIGAPSAKGSDNGCAPVPLSSGWSTVTVLFSLLLLARARKGRKAVQRT